MRSKALSSLIAETSSSFKTELQSKQSLIDQTHLKLRETSSLLANERRRLAVLRQKATDRKHRRQRIANLRRAVDEQRTLLATSSTSTRPDIKLGEADAGLEIDTSLLPPSPERTRSPALAAPQRDFLSSLPPTSVLQARVAAYERNNAQLQTRAKGLQSRSSELEAQLRQVLALCTSAPEENVDKMIEGLQMAVESELGQEVEVGRVREFLRRVERA